MTNIEKAIAALNSFTTGDTENIEKFVAADYIQHNPQIATGKDAIIDFVKYIANSNDKITIKIVRAFEDGEYVVLHSLSDISGSGEDVGFDIFRFEDGLLAEHWDNITKVAPVNISGNSQIDGATEIIDLDKTDENKKLVTKAVTEILINKKLDMLHTFVNGEDYIQHNSNMANGISGVMNAAEELSKIVYAKIHFVLGKGNFVLVVGEGLFDNAPTSYYDLFRVQDSMLAEHWDVMEAITKDAKNNNGKF